jgi:hypothetical protein
MAADPVCSPVYVRDLATEHHAPCLNTFDLQNFERIHNRCFTEQPRVSSFSRYHLQIRYKAQIIKRRWSDYVMSWISSPTTRVVIDCWGASLLMLLNRDTEIGGMVVMLPIDRERSRVFILAVKRGCSERRWLSNPLDKMIVTLGGWLIRGFLYPDIKALTNMRPFQGELIESLDDTAKQYWDYWRKLPRWLGPTAQPRSRGKA